VVLAIDKEPERAAEFGARFVDGCQSVCAIDDGRRVDGCTDTDLVEVVGWACEAALLATDSDDRANADEEKRDGRELAHFE
jgi:hypothetical protein